MERTLELRTGEAVLIRYELAGLGSRFLALAIDLAIQLGVAVVVVLLLAVALPATARAGALASSLALAAFWLASFALFFGYFIAFEGWWDGRTPGKRALGIRVVRDGGVPVDLGAALVRNVVRIVETALGFYTVAAIVAIASPSNKRLGDYAAGTVVVRERTGDATVPGYAADHPNDDGLTSAERDLIERYVRRRGELAADARPTVARAIAERVRPRLRASFDHLDDDELLVHLGRAAAPAPRG